MLRPVIAMAAFGVLLFAQAQSHAADAPATVGALIHSGGKQLTKNEILKLFSGATINGTAMGAPGSTFQLKYMPDGTASGEGKSPASAPTKITGTWSANDRNQYCQDLKTAHGVPIQGCFYYFMLNGHLFAAAKDDLSQPVYERRLTR
jgi:hypothetical protein